MNINFNQSEKIEQKDSRGRTRDEIIRMSKIIDPQLLKSVILKNGQFFIEGKPADEWIDDMNKLDEKDPSDFRRGLM